MRSTTREWLAVALSLRPCFPASYLEQDLQARIAAEQYVRSYCAREAAVAIGAAVLANLLQDHSAMSTLTRVAHAQHQVACSSRKTHRKALTTTSSADQGRQGTRTACTACRCRVGIVRLYCWMKLGPWRTLQQRRSAANGMRPYSRPVALAGKAWAQRSRAQRCAALW